MTSVKRRPPTKTGVEHDDFFDSLVQNAVEFLQRSLKLLEKHPKHSVIDFCTALELFLKARLLREHWALVVSRIEDANLQSFKNGDFQSVTMDKCLQRLHHITNEKLHLHEEKCFEEIRNHRNKVVHFFHRAYNPPVDPSLLADIV